MTGRFRVMGVVAPVATLVVALVAALTYGQNAAALFLRYPVPWPDEALFGDVSNQLLRHGVMGTRLYQEYLPGLSAHYYLTPPLYPALISAVFAVAGFGIVPMRLATVAAAVGVLVLLYALARRTGLGTWLALLPPSLLALDVAFLRGSLIGRMDMLTLGLVLVALWLALPPRRDEPGGSGGMSRGRCFVIGLVAGAAFLSHPIGCAAAVTVLIAWAVAVRPGGVGEFVRLRLAPLLLGLLLILLPWALYILRDVPGFAEQFGRQLMRKSARDFWSVCLITDLRQWGIGGAPVATMWVAGLVGLVALSIEQPRIRLLALGQLVLLALALSGCEIWYGLYSMPLAHLGVVHGARGLGARRWRRWAVAGGFALIATFFAIRNAGYVSRVRQGSFGGSYEAWCRKISEPIAPRSTVLMDGLPTPYFGLVERGDLELRLYPPAGFDVPKPRVELGLERVDYVVAGSSFANPPVRAFAERRGELVAEVGPREGFAHVARIIRIRR